MGLCKLVENAKGAEKPYRWYDSQNSDKKTTNKKVAFNVFLSV